MRIVRDLHARQAEPRERYTLANSAQIRQSDSGLGLRHFSDESFFQVKAFFHLIFFWAVPFLLVPSVNFAVFMLD